MGRIRSRHRTLGNNLRGGTRTVNPEPETKPQVCRVDAWCPSGARLRCRFAADAAVEDSGEWSAAADGGVGVGGFGCRPRLDARHGLVITLLVGSKTKRETMSEFDTAKTVEISYVTSGRRAIYEDPSAESYGLWATRSGRRLLVPWHRIFSVSIVETIDDSDSPF